VDNALAGNKVYEDSKNKDILNTMLAKEYSEREQ
jgi:hypothetical protein